MSSNEYNNTSQQQQAQQQENQQHLQNSQGHLHAHLPQREETRDLLAGNLFQRLSTREEKISLAARFLGRVRMSNPQNLSLVGKFSSFFVRNAKFTFLLLLSLVFIGFFAYTSLLNREGFPSIQVPVALVQAQYLVDDQEKVNEEVTLPLEEAVQSISEVTQVTSTTTENSTLLQVQFQQNLSSKEGAKLLKDEISGLVPLPDAASLRYIELKAEKIDGTHDILLSLMRADEQPLNREEAQRHARELADALRDISDISRVNVLKIMQEGTDPQTGETIERTQGFTRVAKRNGSLEFVDTVTLGIIQKQGADTLHLSQEIGEKLSELQDENAIPLEYKVQVSYDPAEDLQDQFDSLESNALSGLLVVLIVLFLFINWRSALITGIFIPVVFGATFLLFYIFGFSLNTITLFSLILVLGLFVDDAIVVVEAIDNEKKQGKTGKEAIKTAITKVGAADILGTATTVLTFLPMIFIGGTLGKFIYLIPVSVIIALLLSLFIALSVVPVLSNTLLPDAKQRTRTVINALIEWVSRGVGTIVAATTSSLLSLILMVAIVGGLVSYSLFFASQMTFAVFPPPKDGDTLIASMSFPEGTSIRQAEKIAKLAEVLVKDEVGTFITKGFYYSQSGESPIANNSSAILYLHLSPMEEREKTSATMVDELKTAFENFSQTIETSVGQEEKTETRYTLSVATTLQEQDSTPAEAERSLAERQDALATDIRSYLEGLKIPAEDRESENINTTITRETTASPTLLSLSVKLSDATYQEGYQFLQEQLQQEYTQERLAEWNVIEGSFVTELEQDEQVQQVENPVDFSKVSISFQQGGPGGGSAEYPFQMQVYGTDKEAMEQATEEIRDFLLSLELEEDIKVTDVVIANVQTIVKRDGERFFAIKARFSEEGNTGLLLDIEEEIKAEFDASRLEQLGLEEDALGFDLGSESDFLESFQAAGVALLVAIVVMYGLLVLQFNSFTQPLLILLAIPFTFPGVFPGLALTNNSLGFFTLLGFLGLTGIAVNNTIMLLDYINQLRQDENLSAEAALSQAVKTRFRPLLTTTVTTVCGLLPLALSDPFWEPLAFTIVFGLISSTFFVIFFFPAFFMLLERIIALPAKLEREEG